MKSTHALLLALALGCVASFAGEADDGGKKGPPEGKKNRPFPALEKQITFEFVETPLKDVIEFLSQVSQMPIVLDPKLGERRGAPVSLRGKDMPVEQALSWIVKLVQLKWEVHENGVFISDAKEGKGRADEAKQGTMPKLSVKLPDGTLIEADMPLLMMPGMGQQILDRTLDTAADGLIAYRVGRDIPPDVDLEKLKALLAQVAPAVKISHEQALTVLVLSSEHPAELRRAAALMRAFRNEKQRPPFGGPPPDEGFTVRKKPPGPDGNVPPKPPPEAPGQF